MLTKLQINVSIFSVISTHQNIRLTYDELDEQSTALARGLLNAGVRKGQRIAVSLGNNVEYAVLHYALFKIGAVLVGGFGLLLFTTGYYAICPFPISLVFETGICS